MLSVVFSCDEEEVGPPDKRNVHLIMNFSPISGSQGTVVVIHGVHFSQNSEQNLVHFNGGVEAEVLGSTTNSITTEVPANAITGKISVTIDGITSKSPEDFIVQ